jgi:hypothetical protein
MTAQMAWLSDDGKLSWITHLAMAVLMGCAGIFLYSAALVQQSG